MARRIGVLCVVCWGMSAVAWGAEKYDFSEFDGGELFIVQSALRTMEANESAYAYITVNQLKLDVLRMSNKPLTKPGGEHPEKTPPAADVFLLVGGLTKSPKVMKFLKARVSEHNQRLKDNQKKEANRTGSASSANSQATQTPTLRKPAAAQSDLDRLLLLICNGGAVNGEPLPVLTTDLDENSGPAWIERVKQMTSVGGPVGEAAKKLHPAVEDVQAAVDDYKAALARAGEAARNVRQRQEAAAALRNDPLYGASSSELQSMLDRGGQSSIRAQEYMAAAEAANFERFYSFVERIGAGLPELQAASARVHDRLARAEMRRHAVVADALMGPLRERAGPATMEPKLDVKYCVLASGSARHSWEKLAYFVVHSRSTAELTQLTLLARLETSEGTRYVTYYSPSLPAGASARFAPATLDKGALQGSLGANGPQPEIKSVRFSVYCGQFHALDLEPQMITAEEIVTDCWLQSAQPGLSYVTRADGTSLKTDRQYELKFRKLVPSK
ncbi:MAG TPA: hypothetical protein VHB77_03610, partial [Planctomycetaceae bacterium]|nr:hypothetical protein [Planctomycetaceae bacterium]